MSIQIRDLHYKIGDTVALEGIDLSIPEGSFVTIAGPDGAGKTTLLRLLAALLVPTEGTILVAGWDTKKEGQKVQESIGYMPQRFGLYEDLTVKENLTLYAKLRGVQEGLFMERMALLLQMTGLEPFCGRLASRLSGGMKQKLGLACALIQEPRLLLLDEPSVGVDPISRKELWKMVARFRKEGVTILWTTSYLDEAEKGDLSLLLYKGKLLFQGKAEKLIEHVQGRVFSVPVKEKKRDLLFKLLSQREKVLDGKVEGDTIHLLTREPKGEEGWISAPPRFEDGFIDLLGGGPGGDSPLRRCFLTKEEKRGAIDVRGLTKKFGTFTAVDQISFSVGSGEIFGLLGPNGAGKTTTFRMLCGLLQASSGQAVINGLSLASAPSQARAQIGYMSQKFALYSDLSVKQNLSFFSGIYIPSFQKREEAVREMIQTFQLEPYLNSLAGALPMGWKQRLALACALMHRPAILFLDEPTSGVDPITRREFWNHIHALADSGCTILITTHFMDEADYCDRIALMYQGSIIHIGSPAALKQEARATTLEEAFIALVERSR
ncbi:MAG: ABC transporter ATP-binding protein [Verrucomicrobiota bacterium]|nr:ABC transporter ATP-binding protein [Verrucomicrobiota bacterium]